MEIRIENKIDINEINSFKKNLDDYFNIDFSIRMDGDYIYFRDN